MVAKTSNDPSRYERGIQRGEGLEVKARMRRLQMEASQRAAEQSQSVENVKDATVIITNPTHFAVAINMILKMMMRHLFWLWVKIS